MQKEKVRDKKTPTKLRILSVRSVLEKETCQTVTRIAPNVSDSLQRKDVRAEVSSKQSVSLKRLFIDNPSKTC